MFQRARYGARLATFLRSKFTRESPVEPAMRERYL